VPKHKAMKYITLKKLLLKNRNIIFETEKQFIEIETDSIKFHSVQTLMEENERKERISKGFIPIRSDT
tara:strand:+ start:553 stop:756 length:204 start_codon:yes stop_codon:yes gene_type:complete